jgi:SLT domain-containing protein/cell wall-associated NlpC family hydrolase
MALLPPVIVELRAQVDEFTAKMGQAKAELDSMSSHGQSFSQKFGALGVATFAAVGAAAIGVGTEAIHLADAFEVSHARLDASLRANSTSFEAWSKQISAADQAGEKLGFTNAQVEDGLARLETMVKNPAVALKDLAVAEDIARARGIDLTTASNLVGKASEGTYTSLVKLGVVTKEQAKNFQSGADAVTFLGKAFGGQASTYADTFAGKLDVLKATSEDVGKNIGLVLIPIVEKVASALAAGIHWVQDHAGAIKTWAEVITAVAVPALGLWALAQAHVMIEAFMTFLANTAVSIHALGVAAVATAQELYVMAAAEVAAGGPLTLLAAGVAGLYMVLNSGKNLWNDVTNAQKAWLVGVEQSIPAGADQVVALGRVRDAVSSQMDALRTAGLSVGDNATRYDDLGKKLKVVSDAYDKAKMGQDGAKQGSKDLTSALGDQTDATGAAADALTADADAAAALKAMNDRATAGIKAQTDALVELEKRLNNAGSAAEDATRAESVFQQSLDDTTKALQTNKDNLDLNTQAGRDDTSAVLAGIDAIRTLAGALANQGKTTSEILPIVQAHIDALHKTWSQAGLTQAQIAILDHQYGLTPAAITTEVFANLHIDTATAEREFRALDALAGGLTGTIAVALTPGVGGHATGGITSGPALVGEGNPLYPEYVIPTDPAHRANAVSLTHQLMSVLPGLAAGGIVAARPGMFNAANYGVDTGVMGATLNTAEVAGAKLVSAVAQTAANAIAALQAQAAIGSGMGGPGYGSLTSWLGVPYLWGGGHNVSAAVARRTGVDCSGLVDQVYGQTGNTGTQVRLGSSVPGLGASLPGDLVFFGSLAAGEPHHVGIITNAGGTEMIDAPHTGTVVRYDNPGNFGAIAAVRRWPNGPVGAGSTGGTVDNWLESAMSARNVGQDWLHGLEIIARYESGNNPAAVNRTDINAQMGTPSEGLMQLIQPTFDSYKMAGHGNIFNPVDNAIAAIGYIEHAYGYINNVPGVRAVNAGRPYVGYDTGGLLPPGGTLVWNGTGRNEHIVPQGAGTAAGVNVTVINNGVIAGAGGISALAEEIRLALISNRGIKGRIGLG